MARIWMAEKNGRNFVMRTSGFVMEKASLREGCGPPREDAVV